MFKFLCCRKKSAGSELREQVYNALKNKKAVGHFNISNKVFGVFLMPLKN
jgi:hypothetical protein